MQDPKIMRQRGGARKRDMMRAEKAEAKGEMRRTGRRRIPARVGLRRKMDWNRWGMVTTRVVNGMPVKNAFLSSWRYQLANSQI
jgi:hypothetical protein